VCAILRFSRNCAKIENTYLLQITLKSTAPDL